METNKTTTELKNITAMNGSSVKGSSEYKHLDDYLKALEYHHEQGELTPDEVAILDEFRMIKRQLEILEILKTKLIDSYYRDETDERDRDGR